LNLALLFVDIRELLLVGLTLMADLQKSFEHKIAKIQPKNSRTFNNFPKCLSDNKVQN
jgi:hypothetical protein